MKDYRQAWIKAVRSALAEEAAQTGVDLPDSDLATETPPSSELGDLAFPMFPFARVFRRNPAAIAEAVASRLGDGELGELGEAAVAGPYINVRYPRALVSSRVVTDALEQADAYGRNASLSGERVTIEFSSPNTNKPLHLGHLRNDALGESVSRILAACGAEVRSVNLINDRGIHICKSMIAYQRFGNGETPEQAGVKGDRLVGDYYVRYNEWAKEDPTAEAQAREMLRKWEAGDEEVVALWKTMNQWVIEGIWKTYEATGIRFDAVYFESDTYASGKAEVVRGLEEGRFYRAEDGSVWVDLEPINLDKKILLRGDGTSVYLTQDIGTVLARYADWPFDRMIYVVGSEQNYHFRVLFYVLERLGYEWASQLFHLSYGMVNLPEGRMKSREGTVVDADDLIAELEGLAAEEIRSKEREDAVGDIDATAHAVAVGALHYYLLQVTPSKDMIFNPKESLSFTGNTGPYLQYMCARIASMLRKAAERGVSSDPEGVRWDALRAEPEWQLVRLVDRCPEVVRQAGAEYTPAVLATYLYEVARLFSSYYHDYPILMADEPHVRRARLVLARSVLQVLKNGLGLLNIPYLEIM
ncbi:MAG: arginine--tRNA ligase [Spirochaetota bacterium]